MQNQVIRGAIFSVHMPLFFMLSSRTSRYSNDWKSYRNNFVRGFKHLIIPLLVLWLLSLVITMIDYINRGIFVANWSRFIIDRIVSLFWGCGIPFKYEESNILAIGMLYFLYVLFIGRSIYDFFQMKYKGWLLIVFIILLSMVGIIYGTVQWLPFSLDIALTMQPFFYIGDKFRKIDIERNKYRILIISFLIWAFTLFYTCAILKIHYLEIAIREYAIYPLAIVTAVAGTIMVCEFSIILIKCKPIYRQLCYIGHFSLYMFGIHHLHYSFEWLYNITSNGYINTIWRIIVHFIAFYICMFIINRLKCKKLRG